MPLLPPRNAGGGGATSHGALTGVTANQHHAQVHALTGADHTYSGLTTGHVLTATSATAAAFQAPAAGAMTLISDETLGADGSFAAITIPAGYKAILLVWQARLDAIGATNFLRFRLNGDTGSNYDTEIHQLGSTSGGAVLESLGATSAGLGVIAPSDAPAGEAGGGEAWLHNCSGTAFNKTFSGTGRVRYATGADNTRGHVVSGNWRSTAAITSIAFLQTTGNLKAGSRMTCWGLA